MNTENITADINTADDVTANDVITVIDIADISNVNTVLELTSLEYAEALNVATLCHIDITTLQRLDHVVWSAEYHNKAYSKQPYYARDRYALHIPASQGIASFLFFLSKNQTYTDRLSVLCNGILYTSKKSKGDYNIEFTHSDGISLNNEDLPIEITVQIMELNKQGKFVQASALIQSYTNKIKEENKKAENKIKWLSITEMFQDSVKE